METDTIAAIASAPGRGAVALVRISGGGAIPIAESLAPSLGEGWEPRLATLRTLVSPDDGRPIDRALVTVFPAPASYTGEDVVELSTHGGAMVPAAVLDAALAAGARPAEPGEFTRRAYLNGRMTLVQAESVLDLVDGRSPALHRVAMNNLESGLSARLSGFRERLVELEAWLVHHIDFPEEDDAPVPLDRIVALGRRVEGDLARIVETAPEGGLLRDGARVVLAGRPNVGKSSLFNALVGTDRAIVTGEAGTTRDAIEAEVLLGGYPFRLVDTAGLRDSEGEAERLGVEMTRRWLEGADLVLLCVEAGRELGEDEGVLLGGGVGARPPVVLLRTKADLGGGDEGEPGEGRADREGVGGGVDGRRSSAEGRGGHPRPAGTVAVSATTGDGLGALRALLPELVFGGLVAGGGEDGVLTRPRQVRSAGRALEEIRAFRVALEGGVPAEVAAAHLRTAEGALEELVGGVESEEVLDRVFSSFCIGK